MCQTSFFPSNLMVQTYITAISLPSKAGWLGHTTPVTEDVLSGTVESKYTGLFYSFEYADGSGCKNVQMLYDVSFWMK